MEALTAFVDAFYDYYERSGFAREEDQRLPSRDVMIRVCEILLHTSCLREEGRYSSFRVCFITPDSELLDSYLYSHTVLFEKPVLFQPQELHRLAPALNADMSYLMLDVSHEPYQSTGIVACYTVWEKVVSKEVSSGNRMPRIPNILVTGPGELAICFGEACLAAYRAGECVFFRTDAFVSTVVAQQLRKDSAVSEEDRLCMLYRILWNVSKYGHGGHIFFVPSAEVCDGRLNIKYRVNSRFAFHEEGDGDDVSLPDAKRKKEIIAYADMISKFTMVDGAVVLTKDFDLLGFGAETLMRKETRKEPDMCFISYNGREDKTKHFNDNGMRHRSCYHFCDMVEGTVGIIFSHDDVIKACTKHNGRVIVYDHVVLPLL